MPARTRQHDRDEDPTSVWMTEVTVNLERLSARIEAIEGATERNTLEVRAAVETAKIAAAALERIAKADEAREKREGKVEERKARWTEKVWDSFAGGPAFQLLTVGLALAILQLVGTAYIAERWLPSLLVQAPPAGVP